MSLGELDTSRLVYKWRNNRHKSGTAAGPTEDGKSNVLERNLGTNSSRFLLSKEMALAGYIQENKRAYDQLAGRS